MERTRAAETLSFEEALRDEPDVAGRPAAATPFRSYIDRGATVRAARQDPGLVSAGAALVLESGNALNRIRTEHSGQIAASWDSCVSRRRAAPGVGHSPYERPDERRGPRPPAGCLSPRNRRTRARCSAGPVRLAPAAVMTFPAYRPLNSRRPGRVCHASLARGDSPLLPTRRRSVLQAVTWRYASPFGGSPAPPGSLADLLVTDMVAGETRKVAETRGWDTQLAHRSVGRRRPEPLLGDVDQGESLPTACA